MKEEYPTAYYTEKLQKRILRPQNCGFFTKQEALEKNLRLATSEAGILEEGNVVRVYLLIDPLDAVIVDMKFEAYGDTALIGASDALCEIAIRKNILQAKRISAGLIDKSLQDKEGSDAFSKLTMSHVDLALAALEKALDQCSDLEVKDPYASSPVAGSSFAEQKELFPDFEILSHDQKLELLKSVIKEEVEPYVALDEGGIEVKELKGNEVVVGYSGACTSCFSATGATLNAVEQILKQKLHPSLFVTPDLSTLQY